MNKKPEEKQEIVKPSALASVNKTKKTKKPTSENTLSEEQLKKILEESEEKIYTDDENDNFEEYDFQLPSQEELQELRASQNNETLMSSWLNELAEALDPRAEFDKATWKPLPGPQEMAFYSEADELFYGGAAGGGKGAPLTEDVLTPFGWKKAGEIKKSDYIIGANGKRTKVIGVYPLGKRKIFELEFVDGAKTQVTEDHLWSYWRSSNKFKTDKTYILYSPEKGIHYERTKNQLITTGDLLEYHNKQLEAQKQGKEYSWAIIPLCEPIHFERPSKTRQGETIRINPYLLGLLLGDGSICDSGISITTKDEFILNRVREIYGEENIYWDGEKHIVLNKKQELKKQLESYDLWNKKSLTKFIPQNYLFASIESRTELAKGLMDSDGYVDDRGHFSYTSISEQLAKDVQSLFWSLGCKASIKKGEAGYKDSEGNYIQCNDAYTVYIQGVNLWCFVSLPRKQERCKEFNGGVSEAGRRLISIKEVEPQEAVCFAVNNPDGLYITKDFIVTHNSDLMMGLATSELSPHKKAIIFRRSYPELKDIIMRIQELYSGKGVNFKAGTAMRFDGLLGNKTLELGSVPNFNAAQKYKGRPHDLKLFDEVSDIEERVYTFLIGWARSTQEGVPVRVVAAGNPPTTADGNWVIKRWAAWIDPNHPNPAKPGELRWYATLDGEDKEIEDSDGSPFEYTSKNGKTETIKPKSRTFIPAKLSDNPYLMRTDYGSVLQNMPEPYRSQLLHGDFSLSIKPDPWQVVPNNWVKNSNKLWKEHHENGEMSKYMKTNVVYGLDVAEGGGDKTALVKITGRYVQWIEYITEENTMKQANWVAMKMSGDKRAPIAVDAIGVGLGLAQRLKQLGFTVMPIKVSRSTKRKDETGYFGFMNLRSEIWWRVRERLNPEKTDCILIPEDRRLFSEITAPRYEIDGNADIKIEGRDKIMERLGHSPDGASALGLAIFIAMLNRTPLRIF